MLMLHLLLLLSEFCFGEDTKPPMLLIPGLLSSRLVAWKRKRCRGANIDVQDIIWLNLQKMVETRTYDPHCWIDCMKLGVNGTDPTDCRVRADEGLAAIGELCPGSLFIPPGTSIFSSLIKFLANEHAYDSNNLIGMPYDWRLAPTQLQQRDLFFTTMKFRLETAYKMHGLPAIVVTHSMGTNLFMYFIEWIKLNDKKQWRIWLRKHVGGFIGFAAPLLGSPGSVKSVLSGHTFGLTITEAQAREMELTFSSTHFLNPRSSLRNYDYVDPIATFRSASGGSNMSFGVGDIENGDIFRILGSIYKDDELSAKFDSLHDLYTKDPINPLRNPFKRPPIKHVVMVYGVDVRTEVGYSYRMQESSAGIKAAPVLEEIFMEEPCSEAISTALYAVDEISALDAVCSLTLNETVYSEGMESCVELMSSRVLRRSSSRSERSELRAIDKSCKSDIVSISAKKLSQKRRYVKKSDVHHSGDGSVPYVSLSFAHSWLEDADERFEEHHPASVQRTSWPPLLPSTNLYPAVDMYHANSLNGDTTLIGEVSGLDHIEICNNQHVHMMFVDRVVERVYKEALYARAQQEVEESHNSSSMTTKMKKLWRLAKANLLQVVN